MPGRAPQGRRRVAGVMMLGAALAVLTACTPADPRPSDAPFPDVVWEDSPPNGPLEDDAWVKAARTALTALAVAQNRNDFMLPELVASSSYEVRSAAWRGARDRVDAGDRTDVHPGPQPLAPQTVAAASDGQTATVQACVALDWSSVDGGVPDSFASAGAEYRLARTEDDRIILTAIVGVPNLDCAEADPAVGLFDPAPEASTVTDASEIVRPQTD